MLKKLLKGAAVTAASAIIAASAQAAEWDIKVGGYYNAMVSYAQNDYDNVGSNEPDFDGVDIDHGGEVYFRPTITLDNGIKFGVDIAAEGFANDSVRGEDLDIDEAVMFVTGSFGTIRLGSENSAGYNMHFGAPNPLALDLEDPEGDNGPLGTYYNFTEQTEYSAFIFEQTAVSREFEGNLYRDVLGTTRVETQGHNDPIRISYFTPRFAGFQIGMSYARDGERDEGRGDCNFRTCDFIDIGANYVNSFDGIDLAASARWGTASAPDNDNFYSSERSDPEVFGFGLNLGYAGFQIGGSWAEVSESSFNDESQEGQSYDVGASYSTGPWTFSATYFHGEQDYKNSSGGSSYNFTNERETDQFTLGVDYKLAKGIRLNGFGTYVDYSNDSSSSGSSSNAFGTDGFVIGTGIGLSF